MNKAYSCDDELSRSSSSCKGEDSFASSSSPGEDNDEECAALLSGDWAVVKSPFPFYRGRREQEEDQKKKTLIPTPPMYSMDIGDVESMKEKFAKLLLGGDGSGGGRRGVSTALALSNAITDLSGGCRLPFPPSFSLSLSLAFSHPFVLSLSISLFIHLLSTSSHVSIFTDDTAL